MSNSEYSFSFFPIRHVVSSAEQGGSDEQQEGDLLVQGRNRAEHRDEYAEGHVSFATLLRTKQLRTGANGRTGDRGEWELCGRKEARTYQPYCEGDPLSPLSTGRFVILNRFSSTLSSNCWEHFNGQISSNFVYSILSQTDARFLWQLKPGLKSLDARPRHPSIRFGDLLPTLYAEWRVHAKDVSSSTLSQAPWVKVLSGSHEASPTFTI